ncbi:hypothetical protein CXB51_010824 [Gossypium anomalum]|uniref:Aminotransferase-like plant mobile domain-containing protein n=1 Tax=Gossypium anomalum TaxID=47600 RepID=A0A8J5YND2_9ROSI|nr:hypothetical protein CXB51_010824 [Gossypium anomalum]
MASIGELDRRSQNLLETVAARGERARDRLTGYLGLVCVWALFQWTPYEDPAIWVVIPDEFFQNLNIWHVKVPLVNYATAEMHQTDRVLRQFRFRQPIPEAPEVLNDEHKIDLRQSNTTWLDLCQAIFAVGRVEALVNPCRKRTTGPFKSKEKG